LTLCAALRAERGKPENVSRTLGKISGQWPGLPGVTMYLAGNVSLSGDVTIHMHAKRSDGSHGPVMDLAGTLHDGQLDAKVSWLNGRTVTMNWLKN
jgi:hypothetical protein